MKILILVDQLYKSGGLERVLSHKIRYWSQNPNISEISIVTNENDGKPFYFDFPKTSIHLELNIKYSRSKSLFSWKNIIKSILHFIKLRRAINSTQPDIILLCGFGYDFYFLPILKRRARIIKENHSSRYNQAPNTAIKGKLRAFVEKQYDAVIFLSQEEASLVNLPNSYVIPNPIVHVDVPSPPPRRNIVISAGRIAPVKGYEKLIDAWSLIADKATNWKVEIYGDGDHNYIESLRLKITELALLDRISIYPSTPEIQTKMLSSKVYAMTSLTECFPMVLLEAMQLNLPIVSFDCPTGPRNIIEHNKTGLLTPNGDTSSFAESLLKLIESDEMQALIKESAYENSKKYELSAVMQKWDMVFKELAAK